MKAYDDREGLVRELLFKVKWLEKIREGMQTVAAHEIGHVVGFFSAVDDID